MLGCLFLFKILIDEKIKSEPYFVIPLCYKINISFLHTSYF